MIKLYHSPRTRSVRILWLLEELGLPYELSTMPFTDETLKSAAYLKVHPMGKVPAIEDGPVTMFESGAITEYILEKYGNGRLAPAPGSPARPGYLQWLHFAESTAMPPVGDMAQHLMFKPENERIPAVVADAQVRIGRVLDAVEAGLTGDYIAGPEFTAADVMLGYALLLMKWFGMIGPQHPKTAAYLQRLEQRPAMQKAVNS